MKAFLLRVNSQQNQTLGYLQFFEKEKKLFECKTMELPWLDNQNDISCIPPGTYQVKKHTSPNFGTCLAILNVPRRSNILIHKGNYHRDTKGCILPGLNFADIDNDGNKDVTSSGSALAALLKIVPDEFTLTITF